MTPRRLLCLSRYDQLGASSRLRFYQYLPHLGSLGFSVTIQPLLDSSYLERRYAGMEPRRKGIAAAYLRRARAMLASGAQDVVWIEKEALPWLPAWLERLLLRGKVPLVIDFDDAVFHQYDRHRSAMVRIPLGRKIDRVMRAATLVTCCNEYLADRARRAGARRVELLPTVVDPGKYSPASSKDDTFTIGWIGTPGTEHYLDDISATLTAFCSQHDARVVAIGGSKGSAKKEHITAVSWSEADEARLLAGLDVGIMPLRDSPWEQGKCGYKLIQYMAAGLPVVASPVGVNTAIVEDGVNGYLAAGGADWLRCLEQLQRDPGLRQKMGSAGRKRVERDYSLDVWSPRLASLLDSAASSSGQKPGRQAGPAGAGRGPDNP